MAADSSSAGSSQGSGSLQPERAFRRRHPAVARLDHSDRRHGCGRDGLPHRHDRTTAIRIDVKRRRTATLSTAAADDPMNCRMPMPRITQAIPTQAAGYDPEDRRARTSARCVGSADLRRCRAELGRCLAATLAWRARKAAHPRAAARGRPVLAARQEAHGLRSRPARVPESHRHRRECSPDPTILASRTALARRSMRIAVGVVLERDERDSGRIIRAAKAAPRRSRPSDRRTMRIDPRAASPSISG